MRGLTLESGTWPLLMAALILPGGALVLAWMLVRRYIVKRGAKSIAPQIKPATIALPIAVELADENPRHYVALPRSHDGRGRGIAYGFGMRRTTDSTARVLH